MPVQRFVSQMTVARVPARGPLLPGHLLSPPTSLLSSCRWLHVFVFLFNFCLSVTPRAPDDPPRVPSGS